MSHALLTVNTVFIWWCLKDFMGCWNWTQVGISYPPTIRSGFSFTETSEEKQSHIMERICWDCFSFYCLGLLIFFKYQTWFIYTPPQWIAGRTESGGFFFPLGFTTKTLSLIDNQLLLICSQAAFQSSCFSLCCDLNSVNRDKNRFVLLLFSLTLL